MYETYIVSRTNATITVTLNWINCKIWGSSLHDMILTHLVSADHVVRLRQ